MKVHRSEGASFESYGLSCRGLNLGPVGAMTCTVAPCQTSILHRHVENEVFLIVEGRGTVRGAHGESVSVSAGDAVAWDSFEEHEIENPGPDSLRLVSVYWMGAAAKRTAPATESPAPPMLLISTPPTPNGDLHLGHLSGPYLAADILRRAALQRGTRALHISGRDDHQTYVATRAAVRGIGCAELSDEYAALIRETLTRAAIPLDGFIEPNSEGPYADFVADIVSRLCDAGLIVPQDRLATCDAQGNCLHEAYVGGRCPYCRAECDGNACEACGRPNQCVDLIEPVNRRDGSAVTTREIRRLYFRLSELAEPLSRHIRHTRLPARVHALAQQMIDDGLPDICISHPSAWGLPVRVPGFTGHVLYPWFEMAAGYLYGAASALAPGQPARTSAARLFEGGAQIVHSYGFDNAYYHALLFPAVFHGLGLTSSRPALHIVNELLDLEGRKFSTSRRHLIWGRDVLQQVPADCLRYGLACLRPQGRRENFTIARFESACNALIGPLAAWLEAGQALLGEAAIPEPGAWLDDHRAYHTRVLRFADAVDAAFDPQRFAPHEVARSLPEFVDDSLRFIAAQQALTEKAGRGTADYARTARALTAFGLRAFSILVQPLMPVWGEAIGRSFGRADWARDVRLFVPAGTRVDCTAWPVCTPVSLQLERQ